MRSAITVCRVLLVVGLVLLVAWRASGVFMSHAWVLLVWRILAAPYVLTLAFGAAFVPLAIGFCFWRLRHSKDDRFVSVGKIMISAGIWLLALLAWRISGICMSYQWVLLVWWALMTQYLVAGGVIALILLLLTVLCLGKIKYRADVAISENNTAIIEVSYLARLVRYAYTLRDGKSKSVTRLAGIKIGGEKPENKTKKAKATGTTKSATSNKKDKTTSDKKSPEKDKKDRLKPLKQAKSVLTYPDRKIIMSLCLKCIGKFFKALKPKHLDIFGIIGFDDPCTTGWAMGAYEAAAGITGLRGKIRLIGSYHEKACELNIKTSGRTRLWGLIWPFIWLYLRKPIRKVLHKHIFK